MKLRIKFSKFGTMKFIGHLDTQRYFQKLIRRAGIPAAYTEGFSPHQKLSFAQPLGVGVESRGEYFDLEIVDERAEGLSSAEIIKRLNATKAEGIEVTGCVRLDEKAKNAMASVFAADYLLDLKEGFECPFDMDKAIKDFNNAKSYILVKETKKTKRELELKDLVYKLKIEGSSVFIRLNAASGSSVKPMLIIEDFYNKRGYAFVPNSWLVTRLEIYSDGFMPLIKVGEDF